MSVVKKQSTVKETNMSQPRDFPWDRLEQTNEVSRGPVPKRE